MEIFGTTELSYNIEKFFQEETSFFVIVTPYLKLNLRLWAKMKESFNRADLVIFIYRENQLKKEEVSLLKQINSIKLFSSKNLHAKIFANDNKCIISSMNLYEYSQINNHEIGIMIEKYNNKDLYLKALQEIKLILDSEKPCSEFDLIVENNTEYTVGRLFRHIMQKYDLYGRGENKIYYKNYCDFLRRTIDISESSLIYNNTAISRSTWLGKKNFEKLQKEITENIIQNY